MILNNNNVIFKIFFFLFLGRTHAKIADRYYSNKRKVKKRLSKKIMFGGFCFLFFIAARMESTAQYYYNNLQSQFFKKGYLWNPSYAGGHADPSFFGVVNSSWSGFENAPRNIAVSWDQRLSKTAGVGVKLVSEKSGVLTRSVFIIDYAYRIDFADEQQLNIGVSGGFLTDRVSVLTDPDGRPDINLSDFNKKPGYVDGTIGIRYTKDEKLEVAATAYNLKNYFGKNSKSSFEGNTAKAALLVSYLFNLEGASDIKIKPLAFVKFYTASNPLVVIGNQFEKDEFSANLMWYSSGNFGGSAGVRLEKSRANIALSYLSGNGSGFGQQLELGIGVDIKRRNK